MKRVLPVLLVVLLLIFSAVFAQGGPRDFPGRGGGFTMPGGFGDFRGGPGGIPGGMDRYPIVEEFDENGDGVLTGEERTKALEFLNRTVRETEAGEPGPTVTPGDVVQFTDEWFYDSDAIRTIFLEIPEANWEALIEAFANTDFQLLATATVDGETYENVGVRFRGNSSYSMVSSGMKRPLRLKFDVLEDGQNIHGYRTINLLNGIGDATNMRTFLYSLIARDYTEAPAVGFVRLVVNGESWGIYQNQQQFNKDLLNDQFAEAGGVRWKVPGSPNGRGGMEYLGSEIEAYKSIYEIKNRDTDASWEALVELFRVLHETPDDQLVEALEPILNIDGVLRFLALDVALVNADGYWTRASDYYIYLDESGMFHVLPHDMNEGLQAGGGFPGGAMEFPTDVEFPADLNFPYDMEFPTNMRDFFGSDSPGARRGGFVAMGSFGDTTLDPLIALDDPGKPLRSRLLAIPELQERYLAYLRDIAERWLDWETLGSIAEHVHALIDADMQTDTRALYSYDDFAASLTDLERFVTERREFLLNEIPASEIEVTPWVTPTPASTPPAPSNWAFSAGSGTLVDDPAGGDALVFRFDSLQDGFAASKLDQCVGITSESDFAISVEAYATVGGDGLGVRVNPTFYRSAADCEASIAANNDNDRLAGDRSNDKPTFIFTENHTETWLTIDETHVPELAYAAADIPADATFVKVSVRGRDRTTQPGSAALFIRAVHLVQDGISKVVNGTFAE